MYLESEISGKLYKYENDIYTEVPKIGNNSLYVEYVNWLSQPNTVETFEGTTEEITQHNLSKLSQKETELYLKRMQDGQIMYAEISAEFRLAKLSGTITEEQHGAIEDALIPVRNEVLAGQWISALQKLEEIGVAVGSELYQRLHTQITNYINENY